MKALEGACKVILGLFVFLDVVLIFRIWHNGWPGRLVVTDLGDGRLAGEAVDIPFTFRDWLVTVIFVGLQGALGYLVWRLRRRRLLRAL